LADPRSCRRIFPLTFHLIACQRQGAVPASCKLRKQTSMAENETSGEGDVPDQSSGPLIIGVGASAGSTDSIERFLAGLKLEPDQVLVLAVQHREALNEGRLREDLKRLDGVKLVEIADGMPIDAGTIYLCPANRITALQGERFVTRQA